MNEEMFKEKYKIYKKSSFEFLITHFEEVLDKFKHNKRNLGDAELKIIQKDELFSEVMNLINDKIFSKYRAKENKIIKKKKREKEKKLNAEYYDISKYRKSIRQKIKRLKNLKTILTCSPITDDLVDVYYFLIENHYDEINLDKFVSSNEDSLFVKPIEYDSVRKTNKWRDIIIFGFQPLKTNSKQNRIFQKQFAEFKEFSEQIIEKNLKDLENEFQNTASQFAELKSTRKSLTEKDIIDIKRYAKNYVMGGLDYNVRAKIEKKYAKVVKLGSKRRNILNKPFTIEKFEMLPFDIFPKGDITISKLIEMFKSDGMSISYEDEMRLHKIADRFPDYQSICIGNDKFKGFVVFRFEKTDAVIVEKPSYGNATYLIKGDWEKEVMKILQLSRSKARKTYPNKVQRVIHTSEKQWLFEVEFKFNHWY